MNTEKNRVWRCLLILLLACLLGWFAHQVYIYATQDLAETDLLIPLIGALCMLAILLAVITYQWWFRPGEDELYTDRRLGPYHLECLIAHGGMGRVYRARHDLLRRPTAVKVLAASADNQQAIAHFEREVRLTSRLTHPNTIAIYDYGHTPDHRFYYAMEYIPGLTLEACVSEYGGQSEARTIFIMSQVCSALAEAHQAGIIHRDIKPGNVMICERGGKSDVVKVLDFGLVWRIGSERTLKSSEQRGTPLFMSPEALQNPDSQDARSDIYQLGLLMYYFLTGSPAFSADSLQALQAAHLHQPAEPPSKRAGRFITPNFEALILRCLEKDPELRPRDAVELMAELECFNVHGLWGQEQARRWWQTCLANHEDLLLQRYSATSYETQTIP